MYSLTNGLTVETNTQLLIFWFLLFSTIIANTSKTSDHALLVFDLCVLVDRRWMGGHKHYVEILL